MCGSRCRRGWRRRAAPSPRRVNRVALDGPSSDSPTCSALASTNASSTISRTMVIRSAGCRSIVRARPRASTSSSSIVRRSRIARGPGSFQSLPVDLDGRVRVGERDIGVRRQHRQWSAQFVARLLDQLALCLGCVFEPTEHGVEAGGECHHLGRPVIEPDATAQVGALDVLGDPAYPIDGAHRPSRPPPRQSGGRRSERDDRPCQPWRLVDIGGGGDLDAVKRLRCLGLGHERHAEQEEDRDVDREEPDQCKLHPQRPPRSSHVPTSSR